jgi:hypothetical protein
MEIRTGEILQNVRCYTFINNQTIKYTKQNHSNYSECPPWDSMHFSARISSDWVLQQWSQSDSVCALPLQKYDEAVQVFCKPLFGTLSLHHQGVLMMQAASTSETLVNFYQSTGSTSQKIFM